MSASQTRRRIVSALVPGAGHIIDDRTLRGVAFLLLFVFFVCMALLVGNLAPLAAPAEGMKLALRTLAIALAALVWVIAFVSMLRHKSSAS